eukprot:TRINITY_DN13844_c0_g1_i1.p1 TRINITY_DN13844_c0_g1~~TRINITY_DN13844_c0_g1_i1.p1  ORF type:complete len:102 (-),score=11.87 TRINITY_DN13844_c0_g1_i1:994-1299(-)
MALHGTTGPPLPTDKTQENAHVNHQTLGSQIYGNHHLPENFLVNPHLWQNLLTPLDTMIEVVSSMHAVPPTCPLAPHQSTAKIAMPPLTPMIQVNPHLLFD